MGRATLILDCQSGVWARPDTPGQYAFFNASSCPAGWVAANGANGTVDLRGEFIRGWDNGRGVDAGRVIGTNQMYEIQSHSHNIIAWRGNSWNTVPGFSSDSYNQTSIQTSATGGSETRPRNVALLSCMKL